MLFKDYAGVLYFDNLFVVDRNKSLQSWKENHFLVQ